MTQPLNEQDFNDNADLDLIQSELEEWAEYWGSKDTSVDENIQALNRIRNRLFELKGGDPLADVKAASPMRYVEYVAAVLATSGLIAIIVAVVVLIVKRSGILIIGHV